MKLLQRYPWLIPDDDEWVPVEATPIMQTLCDMRSEGNAPWGMPCRPPWARTIVEYTEPGAARGRVFSKVWDDNAVVRDRLATGLVASGLSDAEIAEKMREVAQVFAIVTYWSAQRQPPEQMNGCAVALDTEGRHLFRINFPKRDGSNDDRVEAWASWITADIILLFSFLNCKNVTVQDEPSPPSGVAKKRRKRGIPEIVYKQLVVDGRPITRGVGRDDPEDADFRYHICRGHFADHRGHGLFGKESLKGVYWVPMHVKGSKREGEIIKDYLVRPAAKAV